MELDILKSMLDNTVFEVDNLLYTDLDSDKKDCTFCGIKDRRKVSLKFTIPGEVIIHGEKYSVVLVSYEIVLPEKVKHLVISEGIVQIDSYSFNNHESLETVELPESLNILDYTCFYNCLSLKSVKISDNTSVGRYCFYGSPWYNGLIKNAEIGKDIYLGKTLIGWNGKKKSLTVKPGTEKITIHPKTFFEGLEEIHLPNSIKEVNLYPHENGLKRLFIDDINSYVSIYYPEDHDSLTNSLRGQVDLYIGGEKTDSLIIDNPVSGIRKHVLFGANIKNLVIGEKVNFINTNSIDCTPLEYLKLPPGINVSGEFTNLLNLKELHIDHTVKFLNNKVLYFSLPDETLTVKIEIDSNFNKDSAFNLSSFIRNTGYKNINVKIYFYGTKEVDGLTVIDIFINNLTRYYKNIKVILDREGYKYLSMGITDYSAHTDLYIPEEAYHSYCRYGWNTKAHLVKYSDDEISFVRDLDTEKYKVSCKINDVGENSYRGIIRIPEDIIIDGKSYEVTGLDNFAFFGCKCIEKIILPKDMEINQMAFLDNENLLVERYEEVIEE